jgi:hypothetical protein
VVEKLQRLLVLDMMLWIPWVLRRVVVLKGDEKNPGMA